MKKTLSLAMKGCGAALMVALPLGGLNASASGKAPGSATLKAEQTDAKATGITEVRKINPTTVEIVFADKHVLSVDFYASNIFRLFRDNEGGIIRDPQATPPAKILVDNPRRDAGTLTATLQGGNAAIATSDISLTIDGKSGLMTVKNLHSGKIVLQETAPALFEKNKVTLTFKEQPGEFFYGGGVQNGRFSHAGKSIAIENSNIWVDGGVASPTPFYWSTNGYGLMWHTFKPGRYDFGETEKGKVSVSHNENYLDAFIMVDDTPASLLRDFYQLTGNPVLLPKFGFYEGHLNAYNRDYWKETKDGFMAYEDGKRYNESQKDNGGIKESLNGEKNNYQFSARAAIDRYVDNDMPLGWFLPNDGYGAGYGQTGTLDGNIQNLKEFGDYARKKGIEIGLWTQSDLHPKEGIEALLQRDIVKEVRDAGVRVLKTDVAWVGNGYSFGLNGVADVGNIMPYYGNNARPFIISLDGWAGTQRYAGIWSGDQTGGNWEYIRFHIPTFIGSGLSGQPNITSDVDGIFGGKDSIINVREFQWKTFTPMELNMDGWGYNPKYPHVMGEPYTSINRWYLKLKSELMPYVYTIAKEAVEGKPMVRAMFLEYPSDYTHGIATQYQYLYGPSLLVAPIYRDTRMDNKGNDIRNGIYLPEGTWIDYYTGHAYKGGRIINNFDAPIWKLPVFVKMGSIIPMTNPNNNPTQIRKDYRAYDIYAQQGLSSFTEYDDDGTTQEYLNGRATSTLIEANANDDKLEVTVSPTEGSYEGFEKNKETELFINATSKPNKLTAKVGGKSVKLTEATSRAEYEAATNVYFYEERPNINKFATKGSDFAKVSIEKGPVINVKLDKCDVTTSKVTVSVKGFSFEPNDNLLKSSGALSAPKARIDEKGKAAYSLTPSWDKVENADYYEIEFDGMLYSTITDTYLPFEGLMPETDYAFKVRAVNKDGASQWASLNARTVADPLKFALKGIKAFTTCTNQPGQGVNNLFDFDTKTSWHTTWGKGTAVPFEMTLDLRTINSLDKLVYQPREDAGNGTILEGNVSISTDRQTWSKPVAFKWNKDGKEKTIAFANGEKARYVKLAVSQAVGNFGSGQEMYVFKKPGTEGVLQGDINRDKRIDDADLTSYMNYTGLRRGDADFDYVSAGDINNNGLIDAYDISVVSTQLDGGVYMSNDKVSGALTMKADKASFKAGDEIKVTISGKNLHFVNGLSFALPYDASTLEYAGTELIGMKDMVNLTYDRLHTNGQKALYPTFVNRGNNFLLDEGSNTLFVIKFKAKRDGKFNLKMTNGLLVDRNLGTAAF